MSIDKLKRDTYDALIQYFDHEEDAEKRDERLLCAVPPELLISIVEKMVLPVLTTIIADFVIRKFVSGKHKNAEDVRKKSEELSENAKKEIDKNMKKLGLNEQQSQRLIQYVSPKLTVDFRADSEEEAVKALRLLEELVKGTESKQG